MVENLSVPFDRRVRQEATALRDAGWQVEVICPKGTRTDVEDVVEWEGVRIHRYPLRAATGGARGYPAEYGAALWHTMRLARRVRAAGPVDVVHLCNPPDLLFPVALMLRARGARVVFDQHDLVPELYLSRFRARRDALYWGLRAAEWITYRCADAVIATNESYRATATGRGRVPADRVAVVRSAPDTARFRPVPEDPSLRRGAEHLLCYLGVMGPQDGVDLAVRALGHLADRRDDWHAVLVGDGDARPAAEALVAELGLGDRVTFTGRIPDADVLTHLSTASVCLAPDPAGPLNDVCTMNKILEYMAVGRALVSFDLVEARVSAGPAAAYAAPNDTVAFAGLVSELLDDPARRDGMGRIGRERVTGPLSWEHSRRELVRVYDGLAPAATRPLSVLSVVPDLAVGGAERHLVDLMSGLDRSRFAPSVVCIGEECGLTGELAAAGVPVRALRRPKRRAASALVALVRRMRADRPDVVLVRGYSAEVLGRVAALLAGVPVLLTYVHTATDLRPRSRTRRLADRLLAPRTTAVVGMTRAQVPYLTGTLRYRPSQVRLVPHGIDLTRTSSPARLGVDPGDRIVVAVALMRPEKDHRTLLDAFARVTEAVPAARLLLLGDGALRAALVAHAAALDVGDRVSFLGMRDDVPAVLAASHVAVLSSRSECFPMALLEAMGAGLPVVATAVGGVPEIVDDGVTGHLVPPGDPDALAGALVPLLRDPEAAGAMGKAGRERAERCFDTALMVRRTETMIEAEAGR